MAVLGNDYFLSLTEPVKGCDSEFHKVVRETIHASTAGDNPFMCMHDKPSDDGCILVVCCQLIQYHLIGGPCGDGQKHSGCNAAITVLQGACIAC